MKIEKDKKSDTYVITTEDNEGFHRSLNLTWEEMVELGDFVHKEWFIKKSNYETQDRQNR